MNKLACHYDSSTLSSIYDVLIRCCGASERESERNSFIQVAEDWDYKFPFEYRFMGSLGLGGKVWLPKGRSPRVSCYAEDETPERRKEIEKTNRYLKELIEDLQG